MEDLKGIIKIIEEVVKFIRESGVWDVLVKIWKEILDIYNHLNSNGTLDKVGGIILSVLKLFIKILTALLNIILDLIRQLVGLFK